MFRNILLAIDGSAHASRALAEAADLAQRCNATLTVMTTVPDPSSWFIGGVSYAGGVDFEALAKESEREYRRLLDSAVDALPPDVSVTKILTHGHPGERIIEQAEKGNHDLVVLGSRGRGDVRSLLLGSVSHQVLSSGRGAVLIVHADAEAPEAAV